MTHEIAKRNPEVKLNRAPAARLGRQIGELSRHWVDADFAGAEMEESGEGDLVDRRLAIVKSFLVNHLGLKMFLETRLNARRHKLQYHHLPVQDPKVIEEALALLTDHEKTEGVDVALRELLADKHPYADGTVPEKKWYSTAEADAMGLQYVPRNHEAEVMKMISDDWTTVAMYDRRCRDEEGHGDTRLPAHVEKLLDKGVQISVEYIENSGPSKRPIARYRYFTDEGERLEWFERKRVQEALAAEDAERLRAAKDQAKLDAAAATYSAIERKNNERRKGIEDRAKNRAAKTLASSKMAGGSKFGGWANRGDSPSPAPASRQQSYFRAPAVQSKPTPAPAAALSRLDSLKQGYGAVQVATGKDTIPVVEVPSPSDVPAAELNRLFPRTGSKQVKVLEGVSYRRRFMPRKVDGAVVEWQTSWAHLEAGSA